jgi:hypothetical protein
MPADTCAACAPSRCSVCALRSVRAAVADAARSGRGNGALSVQTLLLPARLYSADVAEAAAVSLPALTALELSGDLRTTPAEAEAAADRLAQGLTAASRHAVASAAAEGTGEAAAGLRTLLVHNLKALPPSLGDALAAMSQLTELHVKSLEVPASDSPAAAQMLRLGQLQSLTLGHCSSAGLAAVLPALTRLTELSLEAAGGQPFRFESPATALTHVTLRGWGKLDVASFAQLPALQQLQVPELSAEGPAPPGGWRLPAQLQTLGLYYYSVKLLSRLQAPSGMVLRAAQSRDTLRLELDRDLLTADGGALLQEGEAALCRLLRFLGQHMADGVGLIIEAVSSVSRRVCVPVMPVGGPDGVGPGRRNHGWLAELGALREPRDVDLWDWQLSAQDLETLSRGSNIRSLDLFSCSVAPLSALTFLGRSPSLAKLFLDVGRLTGSSDDEEEAASDAVLVKAVLLRAAVTALYTATGWRGKLVLKYIPSHAPRVKAELEAAQQDLIAAGVAADIKLEDE